MATKGRAPLPFHYFDNNATTFMSPAVVAELDRWASCANPSSTNYEVGERAHRAVEAAREIVASVMSVAASEIYFASGATEANNIALQGFVRCYRRRTGGKRPHVVTTAFEHKSVLRVVQELEARGEVAATYVRPDAYGIVDPAHVAAAVSPTTAVVSVMHANNELGTVQNIAEIGRFVAKRAAALRKRRPRNAPSLRFHVDCAQTFGKIAVRPRCDFGADAATFSAHKFHGPKGVGGLYLRAGAECDSLTFGGPQESSLRPGTENVAGIRAAALALRSTAADRPARNERLRFLTTRLVDDLRRAGVDARVVSHPTQRLPHSLMLTFVEPRFRFCNTRLVRFCGDRGCYVSVGSACETQAKKSYVMHAIGAPPIVRRGAVRIGMSDETTDADVRALERALVEGVRDQRARPSPPP